MAAFDPVQAVPFFRVPPGKAIPKNAVQYKASNQATGTPGGNRFDLVVGCDSATEIMEVASDFIWKTFQQEQKERKTVSQVTLTVESLDGIAYTANNKIHLNSDYIANYVGDVRFEIIGIIFHEITHVWQWNGYHHNARQGLIEGIADYIRLKAGLAPPSWIKKGSGNWWDEGYAVTAYFLDYCNDLRHGFVASLNCLMKDSYSDDFFIELLGKPVDELWKDYKIKYGSL
ncbi:Basic secretory protease [Thalictrum thalictroides]|uniref:Basic secretory protease n=1 Tax=Thalictrum thalictroides TaxID=46969 RepID=A0A7J6VUJ0_THATH|nr:Basic secretory protease [Thalictrum thalictroides]